MTPYTRLLYDNGAIYEANGNVYRDFFLVPESKLFGFLHFCGMSGLPSSVGQVIN